MTNFEGLKKHALKKARNLVLGATASAVVLVGASGCTPEETSEAEVNGGNVSIIIEASQLESNNPSMTDSEASLETSEESREESEVSNETSKDTSSEVNNSSEETSNEVSENSSEESSEENSSIEENSSEESSEVSDDTSQEEPMEFTEAGLEMFDTLEDISRVLYGAEWGYSIDKVFKEVKDYELTGIHISTNNPDLLDPNVNAVVDRIRSYSGVVHPCYIMYAMWEHPALGRKHMPMYVTTRNEDFAELCSILGVPSNDLSQFNYTSDEIKCFDEEACFYLSEVLNSSLSIKGIYDLEDYLPMEK